MDIIGGILSNMVTFVICGMIMAAGYKVFQMGGDLREIKELLEKMSRRAEDGHLPVSPSVMGSGLTTQSSQDLIRAIHAAGIPDDIADSHPVVSSPEV